MGIASVGLTPWPSSVMEFPLKMEELQPQCKSHLYRDRDICFMFRVGFFPSLSGSLAERGTCLCRPQLLWALKPRPAGMRLCVFRTVPAAPRVECLAVRLFCQSVLYVSRIQTTSHWTLDFARVLSNATAKCEVAQMNGCWEETIPDGCSALWLYLCGCLNG